MKKLQQSIMHVKTEHTQGNEPFINGLGSTGIFALRQPENEASQPLLLLSAFSSCHPNII